MNGGWVTIIASLGSWLTLTRKVEVLLEIGDARDAGQTEKSPQVSLSSIHSTVIY